MAMANFSAVLKCAMPRSTPSAPWIAPPAPPGAAGRTCSPPAGVPPPGASAAPRAAPPPGPPRRAPASAPGPWPAQVAARPLASSGPLRPLDRRLLADPLDRAPRNLEIPGYLSDTHPGRQHLLYCVPVDHPEHPLRLR